MERKQFYALFGDYDTGLTVTELSRYSRSLNGFKSEMQSDRVDFNVFVSDTSQAFVKDEIRGEGISGLYYLSRKNIVANSEKIVIETRDRFRSEEILSSESLTRFLDYDIDYDNGTTDYIKGESYLPRMICFDYKSTQRLMACDETNYRY